MFYNIRRRANQGMSRPAAAALAYDSQQDCAPRVVAAGRGVTAEQIQALAQQYGVPVVEDPVLASALASVNLGDEIPPELYQVVAEVLAYIYRVAARAGSPRG